MLSDRIGSEIRRLWESRAVVREASAGLPAAGLAPTTMGGAAAAGPAPPTLVQGAPGGPAADTHWCADWGAIL